MSEVFSLTSGEMHKEGSERRKKTCRTQANSGEAVKLSIVKLLRKAIGNILLDYETYCYHSWNILQVNVGKRSVAQNLAVDVGIAVAMTGQSHTSLITVTAAMERVALCAVAKVITVCCPRQIIFLHWYLMIKKQRNKQSGGFNLIFFSRAYQAVVRTEWTINYWLSNIFIITSSLMYGSKRFFTRLQRGDGGYTSLIMPEWRHFICTFFCCGLGGGGGGGCWRKSRVV